MCITFEGWQPWVRSAVVTPPLIEDIARALMMQFFVRPSALLAPPPEADPWRPFPQHAGNPGCAHYFARGQCQLGGMPGLAWTFAMFAAAVLLQDVDEPADSSFVFLWLPQAATTSACLSF